MSTNAVTDLLQQYNLTSTNVRRKILSFFIENKGTALSHQAIDQKLDDLDRVTLYRTLKIFEKKGIIHQAVDGSGINKYALCEGQCTAHTHHDDHAHFHCLKCGDTSCIDNAVDITFELPNGYKMEDSHVIIKGHCPKCT